MTNGALHKLIYYVEHKIVCNLLSVGACAFFGIVTNGESHSHSDYFVALT